MENLEYTPLVKDQHRYVELALYLNDVRLLHNLCLDIVKEHPKLIDIARVGKKLRMVVDGYEKFDPTLCG